MHRFFLDIAFYSQNLFIPNVLAGIGYTQSIDLPANGYFLQQVRPYYSICMLVILLCTSLACNSHSLSAFVAWHVHATTHMPFPGTRDT